MEGGGEEAKVKADANNLKVEMAKGNTTKAIYENVERLVRETWALIDVRPKRRTVAARKQGLKLVCVTRRSNKVGRRKPMCAIER